MAISRPFETHNSIAFSTKSQFFNETGNYALLIWVHLGFISSWAWIGQFVFRLKCNNYVNFCNFFVLFVQNLWEISYFFGMKKLCNIFYFACYLLQGFLECSTIIHFDSVFTYFWYNASRMKKTEQITFFSCHLLFRYVGMFWTKML